MSAEVCFISKSYFFCIQSQHKIVNDTMTTRYCAKIIPPVGIYYIPLPILEEVH